MSDRQSAIPAVTKVVKLGEETLMILSLENAGDLPEGDYAIEKITAPEAGVCGAWCFVNYG
jgi:hypothetical protein